MFYKDGKLTEETVEQQMFLSFLYSTNAGYFVKKLMTNGFVNRITRSYYTSRLSKRLIPSFVKKYNINEAEMEKSINEYQSFNDFFIRKLRPDARTINHDTSIITSPADSKILIFSPITNETSFFVKEVTCNLASLLQDPELAQEYEGGTLILLRLAPNDYHRFHFPVDCIPTSTTQIDGIYESVNPIAYKNGYQPLLLNKREVIRLETNNVSDILLIPVGALCVGTIVKTFDCGTNYRKGDEAGYFEFGGSTVVLLFKPNTISVDPEILERSVQGIETAVRVGEQIAVIKN
jgi:phosphatidylserine decarboxylase